MAKCPIQEIARKTSEAGIPFLVIGGYAVYAYGHVRTTEDLDLIVQGTQRAQLSKLMGDLGMSVKSRTATFTQFDSANKKGMNVDLMFVSEDVFRRLNKTSVEAKVEETRVRVVSLLHLIALKCHALKNSKALRRLKDMDDMIQLILINHLDLKEPELRAIVLKYGDAEIYKKLQQACADEA